MHSFVSDRPLMDKEIETDEWKPPEYWKRIRVSWWSAPGIPIPQLWQLLNVFWIPSKQYEVKWRTLTETTKLCLVEKKHCSLSDYCPALKSIQQFQKKGLKHPANIMEVLSQKIHVTAAIMRLILNEDLQNYSYKRRKCQLLTEKARTNRLTKAKKLLNKVNHPVEPGTLWVFSDQKEKKCQNQLLNLQSIRWLVYHP